MIQNKLKFFKRTKLTHDVYELIFVSEDNLETRAGQFMTFLLPSGLRRAYSISYKKGNKFFFIIKRIEEGRGGSKEICDLPIGSEIAYIGPVGHFILRSQKGSKLLIGTGTGFAPIYFQALESLENDNESRLRLIFGVRKHEDIFYEDVLKSMKSKYKNFDYTLYLSREDRFEYRKGYVTDFITKDIPSSFDEFYICGSPQMIGEAKRKLENYGISPDRIYFEQY